MPCANPVSACPQQIPRSRQYSVSDLSPRSTRELAALTQIRRSAVDRRTQLACELRSTLKLYFPQALELCGDDLWTPLALDFLSRWPELSVLQTAKPAAVRAFYQAHRSVRPAVLARRLALIAQARPLTADRAVIDPAILHLQWLVAVLRPMQEHIERIEVRIGACFAAHPEAPLFAGLPAAGPNLAPRLLVAFGTDRSRYPDAASLQKFSGIAPVKEKSGRQLWVHWRCWHDRVPYDESRYLAALSRRHSPLATTLHLAA